MQMIQSIHFFDIENVDQTATELNTLNSDLKKLVYAENNYLKLDTNTNSLLCTETSSGSDNLHLKSSFTNTY